MSELCECGHPPHATQSTQPSSFPKWDGGCSICGCPNYEPRHDPRYDPDDVADIGYGDEGTPYSGMGKVRR